MNCRCDIVELAVAVVTLIALIWPTQASVWIIGIAAIVLAVHAFVCGMSGCKVPASAPAKKAKRR